MPRVRITGFARELAHRFYARRDNLGSPAAPYLVIGGRVWGNSREVLIFSSVARTASEHLVDSMSCGRAMGCDWEGRGDYQLNRGI
jgi:hypothetical protein